MILSSSNIHKDPQVVLKYSHAFQHVPQNPGFKVQGQRLLNFLFHAQLS